MRLFGFEIAKVKQQALSVVPSVRGWLSVIGESYPGAWQRNVVVDAPRNILAFSAVYACVTGIASDVSKLRPRIVEEDDDGICTEIQSPSFSPVLRKPNHYQTRIQFWRWWIISKLLWGNSYALKERDARGVVVALYLLDPQRVTPLVADSGDVYYQLDQDNLSGLQQSVTVPAREIIHDRMPELWHPLVGVSPIYACATSATMGNRIQNNSTDFFQKMSRPSGILTSPGTISDEEALKMKMQWEENYGGTNTGRTAVLGGGLKYEAMAIPAEQAQLIEQLKWTVEDVARCFHYPVYKLGGPVPVGSSVEVLNQNYYSECLQSLFESAELCMDEGLALPPTYYTEFDLDGLLRMDTAAQVKALAEEVGAGIASPDEARAKRNRKPVPGGKYPYLQQQNFSLEALARRDAQEDPFKTAERTPEPEAANDDDMEAAALAAYVAKGLKWAA